jgi:hypothetical protein
VRFRLTITCSNHLPSGDFLDKFSGSTGTHVALATHNSGASAASNGSKDHVKKNNERTKFILILFVLFRWAGRRC